MPAPTSRAAPKKGPKTHQQICYDHYKAMIGRANAYLDDIQDEKERPSVVFTRSCATEDRDLRATVIAEFIQFACGLEVAVNAEGRHKKRPRVE